MLEMSRSISALLLFLSVIKSDCNTPLVAERTENVDGLTRMGYSDSVIIIIIIVIIVVFFQAVM